jgi:hypothetical protein
MPFRTKAAGLGAALVQMPNALEGIMSDVEFQTFTLSVDGRVSITCKRCKRTSYNLNDVEQRYCGYCHVFHDDIWPPARRWWVNHPPANAILL